MTADNTRLTADQLYRLNDALTAGLSSLGWSARNEDDYELLNDAVHALAHLFFPPLADQKEMREASDFYQGKAFDRRYGPQVD